jgi:hypothetical protein
MNEHFSIIGDGAAFELNFPHPFHSATEMFDVINMAKDRLSGEIGSFGLTLESIPSVNFDYRKFWTKGLINDPDMYWSVIFGCDADEDAIDTGYTCKILNAETHPYRYGGGHIHISGEEIIETEPVTVIRLLAIFVGNLCKSLSTNSELEYLRYGQYGRPGRHRIQHYKNGDVGVEYRSPSNAWTNLDLSGYRRIVETIDKCIHVAKNNVLAEEMQKKYLQRTIEALSENGNKLSREIIKELSL